MHFSSGQRGVEESMPIGSPALIDDICTDSVGALMRAYREYGSLAAFPKGSDQTVFAFGPEANRAVFGDPKMYHIVGPPGPKRSSQRKFQQGLFGLNGNQHIDHRRLLMPALRKEAVMAQAAATVDIVDRSLDQWRPGKVMDLSAAMKDLSLSVAGKLLFGMDEIPASAAVAATFQDWLDAYISCLFEMVLPVQAPPGSYEQLLATAEQLEAHFRELIRARQETLRDDDVDLLALLLKAQKAGQINETEVIGEIHTLLNASYQTTASALTWMLLMLTQHPDVLSQLYADQSPALLDGVIRESLRILPPVVFTARRMVGPATLLGQPLPGGTIVIVSFYVTHHDADIFPDPERFLPERWMATRGAGGRHVSPYEYLPFSAGPRMCMGAAFSMQLFQVVIPAIVRRFRLALTPGTRVDRHSNLTLAVRDRLPVTVLRQDGRFAGVPLTGEIHEMVYLPQIDTGRRAA
jgi:cytochrome P450